MEQILVLFINVDHIKTLMHMLNMYNLIMYLDDQNHSLLHHQNEIHLNINYEQ